MKLGIMGGTFNPPHLGHLEAAKHAQQALSLDRVLFIPANLPPHKEMPVGSATSAQRCEMVRRMVENQPWAALSTMEIDRGGASYTVDTLRSLRDAYTEATLFLIIGTDMLLSFAAWREPCEICALAALAVVARDEADRQVLTTQAVRMKEQYGADIRLIDCPALPVSSTELRRPNASEALLPLSVAQYIKENRLYKA